MRTVLTAAEDANGALFVRRARIRDRLAARWRARRLDDELARGVAPEAGPALALRAQRLIAWSTRAALARQLRRIVREARRGEASLRRVPVRRREVLGVAPELDDLAARLVGLEPVAVRGLARLRVLLSDGSGPLYFSGGGDDLRDSVRRANEGLNMPERRALP